MDSCYLITMAVNRWWIGYVSDLWLYFCWWDVDILMKISYYMFAIHFIIPKFDAAMFNMTVISLSKLFYSVVLQIVFLY